MVIVIIVGTGFGSQVGQVDVGLATIDDGIGIFDGTIRCLPIHHRYEPVPPALTCLTVRDHDCLLYLAKGFKKFPQRLVRRVVG